MPGKRRNVNIPPTNPHSIELFNLNFQSLEVVSRYRDQQLQVAENVCDLQKLGLNIYQFFKT